MTDLSVLSASEAMRFLEWLDPAGLHNLVAIDPVTKDVTGQCFDFANRGRTQAESFVSAYNGKRNLYFSINTPKADARPNTKLRRDEIGAVRAFHVDIDGLEGEPAWDMDCMPSAIIDSGNGRWGFWKLEQPIPVEDVAALEAQNRALTGRFHGDPQAHNLDRIARLPGTLNIPNEAKRRKGRVEAVARVLSLGGPAWSPAEVADWCPPAAATASAPERQDQTPLAELDTPANITKAVKWLLEDAPEATEGDNGNATTFGVAARLKDFGVSKDAAWPLLLDFWNDTKASPPWDARELRTIVGNAFAYGSAAPARNAPALASIEFNDESGAEPPKQGQGPQNIATFPWRTHQDYTVKGLIAPKMICILAAPPNAGKSPLIIDIGLAVATGRPWQGMRTKQGYVLYFATEGSVGMGHRMEAVRRHVLGGDETEIPFDFQTGSLTLGHKDKPDHAKREAKRLADSVNARAARFGVPPAIVIIDTYSHVIVGTDSDDDVARVARDSAKLIAAETGAAVVFVHHPTKSGDSYTRGSSILTFDTDLLMAVNYDAKTGQREFLTPRVKVFPQIKPLKFRITSVELGKDQDGDPITAPLIEWPTEFDPVPMSEDETDLLGVFEALFEKKEQDGGKPFVRFTEGLRAFVNAKNAKNAGPGLVQKTENQLRKKFSEALHRLVGFGALTQEGKGKQTQYVRSK